MLPISIPAREFFDEQTNEFVKVGPFYLELEHSLKSISKWESKTHKSFFDNDQMTTDEFLEYVRCMTLNRVERTDAYNYLSASDISRIIAYMQDPMSGKVVKSRKSKKGSAIVMTSENIYFLMINYGIPFECEKWHFNRLSMLIKTCEMNGGGESGGMSYRERQQWYNALNDQRRLKFNTKG